LRERLAINEQIRSRELRVIQDDGKNLGVVTKEEALRIAKERGLDLIQLPGGTEPPIAKIMDYGRYQYELSKKNKKAKATAHVTETKTLQVKIGTSEHDLEIKAKQGSKWLKEGHRIKIELQLTGRTKYMDPKFHTERLNRVLHLVTENYKVAEEAKRSPRGLAVVIERSK
jgi:translation initiation factor IF-3